MFDYETNDLVKNYIKVVGTTSLHRENDRVQQSADKGKNSRRADVMLDVSLESIHNTIIDNNEDEEDKSLDLIEDK